MAELNAASKYTRLDDNIFMTFKVTHAVVRKILKDKQCQFNITN